MTKEILKFALLSVILVLCQVIVFNHICLFGVAVPLVFIYSLVRLPLNLNVNWVMTLGFLLGLTVDVFSNTQGVNALSCTLLSVCRTPVMRLYVPRVDDLPNPEPSVSTLGWSVFMKYALTLTALYCTFYFVTEAFSFFDFCYMLLRIVGSTVLTFIVILAFDGFNVRSRK